MAVGVGDCEGEVPGGLAKRELKRVVIGVSLRLYAFEISQTEKWSKRVGVIPTCNREINGSRSCNGIPVHLETGIGRVIARSGPTDLIRDRLAWLKWILRSRQCR